MGKCIPALLALILLLAGCGERPVPKDHPGLRLVAMAPSITEILYALGLGDQIVGVSTYSTYPPEAAEKPIVGGLYDPNWEVMLSLQPDLVIGQDTQTEMRVQLDALGIEFIGVAHESIDDILQAILTIGEACDATEKSQALFESLTNKVGQASSLSSTTPSVLVCVGHNESLTRMYIAAPGTLYDELIRRAGGINACETSLAGYPEISPEGLIAMRPDIVIDIFPNAGKYTAEMTKTWERYCQQAVIISNTYASIPGPRIIQLLDDFSDIIQKTTSR